MQIMTSDEIINTIANNFLCVRRLPFEVISHFSYREGDEERVKKPIYLEGGKILDAKRSVIFSKSWNRKMVREERVVEKGGWWYVKEEKHTGSTITFNRKYDKFFAPTLKQAIELYLKSKINE